MRKREATAAAHFLLTPPDLHAARGLSNFVVIRLALDLHSDAAKMEFAS